MKPLLPATSNTEFIINGKKEIADPREETLSSKAGGLKQALQQIFGNRPDIAADLKANEFPGPKTVPFERPQPQVGDKPTPGAQVEDPAYLRNQKGDKVPTGDLRDELAELKSGSLKSGPALARARQSTPFQRIIPTAISC